MTKRKKTTLDRDFHSSKEGRMRQKDSLCVRREEVRFIFWDYLPFFCSYSLSPFLHWPWKMAKRKERKLLWEMGGRRQEEHTWGEIFKKQSKRQEWALGEAIYIWYMSYDISKVRKLFIEKGICVSYFLWWLRYIKKNQFDQTYFEAKT